MARAGSRGETRAVLPGVASRYLRRRAEEIGGVVLVALAAALAVALVGFDAADPSLNTAGVASGRPVLNPLGYAGAVVADLLLQSLGLASALLVMLPAIWGWRMLQIGREHVWTPVPNAQLV